jgi:hypothetical protein
VCEAGFVCEAGRRRPARGAGRLHGVCAGTAARRLNSAVVMQDLYSWQDAAGSDMTLVLLLTAPVCLPTCLPACASRYHAAGDWTWMECYLKMDKAQPKTLSDDFLNVSSPRPPEQRPCSCVLHALSCVVAARLCSANEHSVTPLRLYSNNMLHPGVCACVCLCVPVRVFSVPV